jgi:hypothetical protein
MMFFDRADGYALQTRERWFRSETWNQPLVEAGVRSPDRHRASQILQSIQKSMPHDSIETNRLDWADSADEVGRDDQKQERQQ